MKGAGRKESSVSTSMVSGGGPSTSELFYEVDVLHTNLKKLELEHEHAKQEYQTRMEELHRLSTLKSEQDDRIQDVQREFADISTRLGEMQARQSSSASKIAGSIASSLVAKRDELKKQLENAETKAHEAWMNRQKELNKSIEQTSSALAAATGTEAMGASLAAAQRRLARAHSRAASESAEADRLRARCAEMSSRTAEADAELRTERAVVERLRETRQREATALEEERKQHAAQRGQTAAELNSVNEAIANLKNEIAAMKKKCGDLEALLKKPKQ